MKKITSLLLALVCTVGAWAQTLPFKTSAAPTDGVWADGTTWYFMSVDAHYSHSGGYLAAEGAGFISQYGYDNSGAARVSKGKLLISQTTKPIKPSALWCVVGDETNGYTFYNKMNPYLRLGMPEALNAAKLYGGSDIDGVVYTFKVNESSVADHKYTDGYCAIYSGTNSYWNDSDGENPNFLSTWSTDDALRATGSAIRFEEVTATELAQMAEAVKVPVSTESNKVFFRIKGLRSTKYVKYNGDAASMTQVNDEMSLSTIWYVMADGDGYYIYNGATSKKYASLSSFTDTGTKMYIRENPFCAGYFNIASNANFNNNACWDDNQSGGFSAGWAPSATDYAGTSWMIETVGLDEIKEGVSATIASLQTRFPEPSKLGYYTLTDEERTAMNTEIAGAQTALEDDAATVGQLMAILDNLNAYLSKGTLVMPTPGLYRIKSMNANSEAKKGLYLQNTGTSGLEIKNLNGANSVFYIDADNKILSFASGQYLNNYSAQAAVGEAGGSWKFVANSSVLGAYAIQNPGDNSYFLSDWSSTTNTTFGQNDANAAWAIEAVEWLPVPMNTEAGYATLYSPVQLSAGGRVKVYTAAAVSADNKYITLSECDVVPANTGVILEYVPDAEISNGCVYLQVQAAATTATSSLLGTYAATNIDVPAYVLSNKNGIGLYKADMNQNDGAAWLNNGFKAYLPASALNAIGGEAPMLTFDFGTATAIENVTAAKTNGAIYDLSGRRVKAATKGIFIINGKKVIK